MSAQMSAAEAARVYGLSEKTVRRWIRAGRLRADMQAGTYSVALDDVSALAGRVPAHGTDSGADNGTDTSAHDARPSEPPGTDIMRAEAMAAYTRSVLEPLVTALERSEARSRELTAENAELRATVAAQDARIAALLAPTATQAQRPSTQSSPLWLRLWRTIALAY